MQLGPLQEAWVKSLEDHPERQMDGQLGQLQEDGSYKACCLGEGLCVMARIKGERPPFDIDFGVLKSEDEDYQLAIKDYSGLGIFDGCGIFIGPGPIDGAGATCSLAELNDAGYTWPQIAKIIRNNPERIFTKSV